MPLLKRPSSFEEGVEQLLKAKLDTQPHLHESKVPRARLWNAVDRLVTDDKFIKGMKILYDANQIVSFLFHTIVPHLEERLRYTKLEDDFDKAKKKPDALTQNSVRFDAIIKSVCEADKESCKRSVDDQYERMRDGLRPLSTESSVLDGLKLVYVSSKTARKCLDLIFQRLLDTLINDDHIVQTSDIPLSVLMMGT